jgi:NADH-quinone oxidoreductase subunit H
MALMLAYEATIVLVVAAVALRTGLAEGQVVTFSLAEIARHQQQHGAYLLDPVMWPALAAFVFFYPANLGIVPFDIPEAETEILEGPLLEYSGPALALFKVMSALKNVVVLGLGITLFFPFAPSGIAGLAVWLVAMLALMVVGVSAVRVSLGRMRIDQAFSFFLKWPLLLAAASLTVVVVV